MTVLALGILVALVKTTSTATWALDNRDSRASVSSGQALRSRMARVKAVAPDGEP